MPLRKADGVEVARQLAGLIAVNQVAAVIIAVIDTEITAQMQVLYRLYVDIRIAENPPIGIGIVLVGIQYAHGIVTVVHAAGRSAPSFPVHGVHGNYGQSLQCRVENAGRSLYFARMVYG